MDLEKVREALESCSSSKSDSVSNVQSLKANKDLINGIIQNLPQHYTHQLSDGIYNKLFELYQSGGRDARLFVLQFIPVFIWISLSATAQREKQAYGKLEAILLAIYNAEVSDNKGQSKSKTFRLPSLSRPSIYHEPLQSLGSASALTVSALNRHEQIENPVLLPGPGRELDRIVAAHRMSVLSVVLNQYNSSIAFMTEASQKSYSMMALRVAKSGFSRLCDANNEQDKSRDQFSSGELEKLSSHPRITLNAEFIQELLQGLVFLIYNGQKLLAAQAIADLKWRASHSLFASAHLLTNAIENAYRQSADEGPLGLQLVHTVRETDSSGRTQSHLLKTLELPADGEHGFVALQTRGMENKRSDYEEPTTEGKNEVDSGNIQLEWIESETKPKSSHKKSASSGAWKIHLVSQKAELDLSSTESFSRVNEETLHSLETNKSKGTSPEVNLISYSKINNDHSGSQAKATSVESAL